MHSHFIGEVRKYIISLPYSFNPSFSLNQRRKDLRIIFINLLFYLHACSFVCLFSIDYLEQCTELYKVNRYTNDHNCPFVEYGLRVNTNEHERQLQDNYKTRTNIVISDMDTTNTCDRPLIKLLRIYCCDWNCQSPIFKKFQVSFIKLFIIS
jgi:hypothetical protein